jgi:hypothetical protein
MIKPNIDTFGPPDSANTLWYDPFINRFEDECGKIMDDLSPYFDTWQLDQWKKTKEYALMKDKNGDLWEIFYNTMNEYRHCQHFCDICSSKCEIYNMIKNWKREEMFECVQRIY